MSTSCKVALSKDVKALLSEFQHQVGLFNEGYNYQDNPDVSSRIAKSYMDRHPDFCCIEGWGTPLTIYNECRNMKSVTNIKEIEHPTAPIKKKEHQLALFGDLALGHGGKRAGSGRKKAKKPSKVVRVPGTIAEDFAQIVEMYKRLDEKSKDQFHNDLVSLKTLMQNSKSAFVQQV
ncbi:hypothetical protein [Vibrio pectenicida]|uniref:Uncharacterized protein n=1 Tax=Vibrio pectenicida TaxID=62763 RepID=A0A3R9F6F8_9VIBR|nr:hypothetical protein [Vibrio pectenicida]RSD30931.1 hypothetical protein EJA03_11240 [Vibrio pectenicida]